MDAPDRVGVLYASAGHGSLHREAQLDNVSGLLELLFSRLVKDAADWNTIRPPTVFRLVYKKDYPDRVLLDKDIIWRKVSPKTVEAGRRFDLTIRLGRQAHNLSKPKQA